MFVQATASRYVISLSVRLYTPLNSKSVPALKCAALPESLRSFSLKKVTGASFVSHREKFVWFTSTAELQSVKLVTLSMVTLRSVRLAVVAG
jgi:hypothetical protein